jgi:hypothetical protein
MSAVKINDNLAINFTIYCEDVRPELNGKWSILGVFSAELLVAEFPANLKLAFYFEAQVAAGYKTKLHTRIRLDDTQVAIVSGDLKSDRSGITAIPIPAMILPFPKAGFISIDFSTDEINWTEVASKEMRLEPALKV